MDKRETVERLLKTLAANARAGEMGISDWRWFYAFVVAAASSRTRWCASDVQQLLTEQGVDESLAQRLGELYGHCRAAIYCAGRGNSIGNEGWLKFLS